MNKAIQCLTCLFEQSSGVVVDDTRTNVDWAEEIGVAEGSIRRHKKHSRTTALQAVLRDQEYVNDTHDPVNGNSYTRMADTAWGKDEWREFLRLKGTDPDTVTFTFGVTSNPSGGYWNKLLNVRETPVSSSVESLTHLYAELEARPAPTTVIRNRNEVATVVCLADWQLGKTGRRGGTKDTLARLSATRAKLEGLYGARGPGTIVLLDLGDGIEGFESGGDPQFTNDLSLPEQLDAYSTEMFKFVAQAHEFAHVKVAAVPSNHAAWRRGKQSLGKPSDDFGIYVHGEVAKVARASGREDVTWTLPDPYDESVCVDVLGTQVGAVHGNQFGSGKAIDWWQAQAFGSQASTRADVLVTGHYHTFGAGVAGINPFSGKERYWLGAPTVDNGSDWYRGLRGRDSLPGTLVFDITEDGFDLASLTIL